MTSRAHSWGRLISTLLLFWCVPGCFGASQAWNQIAPWFQPPPALENQFGGFRSPLEGRNGGQISSALEWARRRAELLQDWQNFLGPWPELLANPSMKVSKTSEREGVMQSRVVCDLASGLTGEGWLLKPTGAGPFPAVLVVYYEPETSVGLGKEPLRDFGWQLAKRGFVTLSIGTPGGNAWKPEIGGATCQPLSYHAYVAANCWRILAADPLVDSRRIGVVGHSYGGKWALFAGAFWEMFAAVAVSDPGIVFDESRPNVNYWEPWYLGLDPAQARPARGVPSAENPRTGPYKLLREQNRDLHELHALICPRPFFVSGGAEDPPSRWEALNHSRRINRLLGVSDRIGMDSRATHAPTSESNDRIYAFFEWALKELPQVSQGSAVRPLPVRP